MKITIVISSDEDFDAETLIDWINDQLDIENMHSGSNMVAELVKEKK